MASQCGDHVLREAAQALSLAFEGVTVQSIEQPRHGQEVGYSDLFEAANSVDAEGVGAGSDDRERLVPATGSGLARGESGD